MEQPHRSIATPTQQSADLTRFVIVVYVQPVALLFAADGAPATLSHDEKLELLDRKPVLPGQVLIFIASLLCRPPRSTPPSFCLKVLLWVPRFPLLRLADVGVTVRFVMFSTGRTRAVLALATVAVFHPGGAVESVERFLLTALATPLEVILTR